MAKVKTPKPCKKCEKKRYGNLAICYSHYMERERVKREEKAERKKLRKQSTKKYQVSQQQSLHKKCWTLMSEWVRRREASPDGFNSCYTCGTRKHWKKLQGGHRHHRTLDFDERNIHPQCANCNMKESYGGLSGNLGAYENRLIKDYGIEWADKLTLDANTHPGYNIHELMQIQEDLTNKLKEL